jgi:hypothetical protein
MLAARIRRLRPRLLLAQDGNNLFLNRLRFIVRLPQVDGLYSNQGGVLRAQVIRSKANRNSTLLCPQAAGAVGTIVGGPAYTQGYTWWNINYDTGCDGWSIQDYLTTSLATGSSGVQVAANTSAIR